MRAQRRAHLRLWLVVAPLVGIGLIAALLLRPSFPPQPPIDGAAPLAQAQGTP